MKRNIDILKEWESIDAGFSVNIGLPLFSVPEGYFDALDQNILSGVLAISAPELQFQKLVTPYAVPQNYFEHLDLMAGVKAATQIIDSTSIDGLSKTNVYEVPSAYFEHFEDAVWEKLYEEVAIDEELEESPLLASLKSSNPFAQPEEKIEIAVPQPTQTIKETPVIEVPMQVKKKLRWSSWVAAASVALFFVLGAGWLQMDNNQNKLSQSDKPASAQEKASRKLAAISDQDIDKYMEQHVDEFNVFFLESELANTYNASASLDNVSDAELEAYVNYGL